MTIDQQPHRLSTHFPIHFKNGHRVETVAFWCTLCGRIAKPHEMTGHVSRIIDTVADISAGFKCTKCGKTSTYRIRLKDDKSYSYLHADKGEWFSDSSKRSLFSRMKLRLNGYIHFSLLMTAHHQPVVARMNLSTSKARRSRTTPIHPALIQTPDFTVRVVPKKPSFATRATP